MKIRFEVARGRSFYWPHFVQRAKKHASYAVSMDGPVEMHSVEVHSTEAAIDIWQVTRSWKGLTIYVDGKVMGTQAFSFAMHNLLRAPQRTSERLRGIIEQAAKKRDRDEASKRRRQGLGPDPELGF